MNRSNLKAKAKQQIKGNIGILFLIALIVGLINGAVSSMFYVVGALVVTPALTLGVIFVYLDLYQGNKPEIEKVFTGFNYFWSAFKVIFLTTLYTFLWSLLLIIPGIIKMFSYSQAMYIIAENPNLTAREAINRSMQMMNGHKMEYFVLNLSFLGWILLSLLTFGILFIYVEPYMQATYLNYYKELSSSPIVSSSIDSVNSTSSGPSNNIFYN